MGCLDLEQSSSSHIGVLPMSAMNDIFQFIVPASDLDVIALGVCVLLLAAISLTEGKVPW